MTRLSAEGARVTNQSITIRATESERVVRPEAIALGAPFHVWRATLVAASSFAITGPLLDVFRSQLTQSKR